MGFFSKKKQETSQQENPNFLALVEKWDGFLDKMKTRFFESLINAEEALLDNLEESNYDLNPTMVAWQGIKSQLMALGNKVNTTFDEKVLPQMLQYKEHYDLLDQTAKGTYLREKVMFKGIKRFEIILEGKVSTKFYKHAVTFLNEDFNCTQCSAKVEVNKDIFHAHYVSCNYCNTVNTFTPNDKISGIRWVIDNIAKHEVITDWDAMEKARENYNELRSWSEGEDMTKHKIALKEREDTECTFWTNYFTARSAYLPQYKETIAHDTGVKMKWFYEERKREFGF